MCVEVLACQIRRSRDITGFLLSCTNRKQFKVRQYADDNTSFVKDYYSLVSLFDFISIYEKGSGAKLNRSKTKAMWLGEWRTRTEKPLELTWVRKMKILGVFFSTVLVHHDNWEPRINKLEKSLNMWKSCSLSLLGKSLVINVLGMSEFFYLAKVLVSPSWVLSRVNQLLWPFLWGLKIETVSRNTCFLLPTSGGLNVSSLELKCAALCISSIASTISQMEDLSYFLCKYFIGHRLAAFQSGWRSLRDNLSPNAALPCCFYESLLGDLLRKPIP